MLHIHCLQHRYSLSDLAAEEALYDVVTFRKFAGVDMGREAILDETPICMFRHLLKKHDVGRKILQLINRHLAEHGLRASTSIILTPSSTKNKKTERS